MSKIVASADILGGKPVIEGTRITVEFILDCLASGMSQEDILKEYSHLKPDDITACLKYAAQNLKNDIVMTATK
jgi:uncharacterized protein (DUF433 family)